MQRFLKILWPLLLVALVAALYLETSTVEHVGTASDSGIARPAVSSGETRPARPATASRLAVGQRYASATELIGDQEAAGFLRTGSFGNHWPAKVTEIAIDQDGISFLRRDGTRHSYTKFDGYAMKMVRLEAGAGETILVFRSTDKR